MPALSYSPVIRERRHQTSRDALLTRVVGEFQEMPCLRLTAGQAQRLFDLRSDVCQRVLATLINEGTLTRDNEQRYRLSDARISQGALFGPAQ
jgi:DNA-binding IclR family transcriptional regulator